MTGAPGTEQAAPTPRGAAGEPQPSAVIVNPVRVADLPGRRKIIEETLAAAGWPEPAWFETTVHDPGTGQARRAVEQGAGVVFVCGGDGTVRSVITGLVGSAAALAILPAGTGNLLALNLELPSDPAAGVRLAIDGGRRRLDVGDVDGQAFAVMAGMGFDAAMMGSASADLKARFGSPAYVVSALKHLGDRSMRVAVHIDDHPPVRTSARSVLIGNVGQLQGGIRLMPDAEPDSGTMEIAILTPRHLGHWAALSWGVLTRRKRVPRMQVRRGRRIRILADRPQPRQLDGDVITPGDSLTVDVLAGALLVCVPR